MKCLFLITLLFVSVEACTQTYIKKGKDKSLQQLSLFSERLKQNPIVEITDSTIKYFIHDSLQQHYSLILHFDDGGKCDIETHIWSCDSCFQKTLAWQFKKSHLGWSKISNTTYLSKAHRYLLLEMNDKIPFSFIIRNTRLSFKEATDLIHNSKYKE